MMLVNQGSRDRNPHFKTLTILKILNADHAVWFFMKETTAGPLAHIPYQLSVATLPPSGLTLNKSPGFSLTRSLEQSLIYLVMKEHDTSYKKNCISLSQMGLEAHPLPICQSCYENEVRGCWWVCFVKSTMGIRNWAFFLPMGSTQWVFCPVMGEGNKLTPVCYYPEQTFLGKGMVGLTFTYNKGLNFCTWSFFS